MFKPGKSGNPKGKPKVALHKATRAALALLEGDLEANTEKLVEKAKEGDLMAVKLILDKLIPNAKERRLSLKLPKVGGATNLPAALAAVLEGAASGEITPGEGQTITGMLEVYRKGVELNDIEARVKVLEGKR